MADPSTAHRLASARAAFLRRFGHPPARAFRAPGRVNLIGEHTDYSGGLVLPMAIDRDVLVLAAPSSSPHLHLYTLAFDQAYQLPLDANPQASPSGQWSDYARGVLSALRARGVNLPAADFLVDSTVPIGSGLSSSAAFTIALARALVSLAGHRLDPVELGLVCQEAEQQAAGVQCGIMDQFAAALSRRGSALFIDCARASYRHVPFDERRARVVVADSATRRVLAEGSYNARRQELEQGLEWLRRERGLSSARDADPDDLDALLAGLASPLARRVRHVVEENRRVEASVAALERDEVEQLGQLMAVSHASLRDLYDVSTPELDALVQAAAAAPGYLGAKLSGAGFGGSTVNLVRPGRVDAFCQALAEGYRRRTGLETITYPVHSADGASELPL